MAVRLYKTGLVLCIVHGLASSQTREHLSLDDAVAIALEKNPRILTARQEIEAYDARILRAGAIPNPEIDIAWNEAPTNFNIGEADERDIGITQSIEFPTRRSARIDVATQDWQIAELRLERTKTLIAVETKKAYYETLFGQEIIDGLEEQLDLLQDMQKHLHDQYQAGAGSYLDVIRAKVEVARLNNDVTEAKRVFQMRWTRLNLLLGNDTHVLYVLTDSLAQKPFSASPDSVVQTSLEKSATLKIVQSSIRRGEAAVSLANASYLPDFSLGLFHQWRAEEPPFDANQFYGTTSTALGFELGISVPLWFWHGPKGEVQEAEAMKSIARMDSSQVARRVRAAILNAIAAVQVAGKQLGVFDEMLLNDTKDIVATGMDHYRNNQIDLLNLLDIHRTARATRVEYARALLNHAVALAELEAAGELPFEEQSE